MDDHMDKSELTDTTKVYYTIGEVAEMLGENISLIRYWESHFSGIKARRNSRGHRLYTREQLLRLKSIHHLVKVKRMTLEGANDALRSSAERIDKETEIREKLLHIREFLKELREQL